MRSVKSWSDRTASRLSAVAFLAAANLAWGNPDGTEPVEKYLDVPMPPGFSVQATELEGPVFTNADGKTLYTWPQNKQRNGYSGEPPGTPACYDEVLTVTAGLMSPYPPGIELPDLDSRPSCMDLWHPEYADVGAEEVGKWTVVERRDGTYQWAWDEQPVYTSIRDSQPGDVLGGTKRRYGGDSPANRVPIGPPSLAPPGFGVRTITTGRILTTDRNYSVYAFDGDTATSTACDEECTRTWRPVIAPALAKPQGEWDIFERSPGVRQWVFRGQPLYTNVLDQHSWSQQGSDVVGWSNVFTQRAPEFPPGFKIQKTISGDVLADARGMTIYTYVCGDDSQDQLSCDHPDDTQVYRFAMCGAGDPERCLVHWPYVEAGDGEVGTSRTWSVMSIDPMTGRKASPEDEGAISVWAYRDRPVYTYGLDESPGDLHGGGTGEWRGQRNGLKAFMIRDDFLGGTM